MVNAPLSVKCCQVTQIEIGQRAAADHQKWLIVIQQVACIPHAPGCAERRFFDDVLNTHSERLAVPVGVLNLGSQVLHGNHHLLDAVLVEQVEDVAQYRAVHHG
jgi:hypothetical protein